MSTNSIEKKIIITGSNGYIGSNLVRYFSKFKNFKIFCILNKKKDKKIFKKKIKYIKHNLLNKIPKNKIKEDIDAILHFAGPKNDRDFVNNNKEGLSSNFCLCFFSSFCKVMNFPSMSSMVQSTKYTSTLVRSI